MLKNKSHFEIENTPVYAEGRLGSCYSSNVTFWNPSKKHQYKIVFIINPIPSVQSLLPISQHATVRPLNCIFYYENNRKINLLLMKELSIFVPSKLSVSLLQSFLLILTSKIHFCTFWCKLWTFKGWELKRTFNGPLKGCLPLNYRSLNSLGLVNT